jgi:polyisoprenoid-binding protein YceI
MKFRSWFLILVLGVFSTACRESAVDQATPAAVTESSATTETATASDAPVAGTRTNVIKEKSKIEWVGAKVTRDHDGKFNNFDGWIEYVGGQPTNISFDIDTTSIQSDDEKLTGHLKSPDFFDVAKFPKATFVSTSLTPAAAGAPAGATHELKGNLTMHGVTKEVTIPVKAEQTAEGVRTTSEFSINRHDWGISYKGAADDLIKDNVVIKLDLMFPPPPAA